MAAWESKKSELEKIGCTVYAASVDAKEHAQSVVETAGITFPVAYGCTEADAHAIGAWLGDHPPDGIHIQPTEFILRHGGLVLGSMYASGPVGRIDANEAVAIITSRERRRMEQSADF